MQRICVCNIMIMYLSLVLVSMGLCTVPVSSAPVPVSMLMCHTPCVTCYLRLRIYVCVSMRVCFLVVDATEGKDANNVA